MTNSKKDSELESVVQIIIEQAVSQGQTNSSLRDNRNPREKVLYAIAERYTKQVLSIINSKYITKEESDRRVLEGRIADIEWILGQHSDRYAMAEKLLIQLKSELRELLKGDKEG